MIAAQNPARADPKTRAPGENHDRGQRRRQRAGEPRRKWVFAEEMITGDLTPVGERRFIETITIVEIRHDIIAPLDHLARSLGETRFIAIDQRQRPGAGEMKKQAPAEEGERNCELQVARERFKDGGGRNTTGKFSMHKIAPAWKWLLLLLLAIIAIAASFHFDAAVRQWVVEHSNHTVETSDAQRQPLRRLAGARARPDCFSSPSRRGAATNAGCTSA